jgi:hypothetical protein
MGREGGLEEIVTWDWVFLSGVCWQEDVEREICGGRTMRSFLVMGVLRLFQSLHEAACDIRTWRSRRPETTAACASLHTSSFLLLLPDSDCDHPISSSTSTPLVELSHPALLTRLHSPPSHGSSNPPQSYRSSFPSRPARAQRSGEADGGLSLVTSHHGPAARTA